MAAPHVVGLAALLISADPNLRGQVDSLVTNIEHNALPITTTQTCGSDLAGAVPNNVYGWGRVDAWASYLALPHYLHVDKAVPATSVAPGQVFTYTLTLIHQDPLTITHNVILTDVIPLETSLITATTPFTFDEGLVRWDFPSLGLKETRLVNLTIQVPVTATGSLVNRVFVSSAEVPVITGTPVITLVRRHSYFPILMK